MNVSMSISDEKWACSTLTAGPAGLGHGVMASPAWASIEAGLSDEPALRQVGDVRDPDSRAAQVDRTPVDGGQLEVSRFQMYGGIDGAVKGVGDADATCPTRPGRSLPAGL